MTETKVQPRERGILFSGPMVNVINDGLKTQTRRVVLNCSRKHPDIVFIHNPVTNRWWPYRSDDGESYVCNDGCEHPIPCPYGRVGDLLYVKETHYLWTGCGAPPRSFTRDRCYVDHPELRQLENGCRVLKIPSIHMPKWAARIWLQVTDVRVQRVQEITPRDAMAEGIDLRPDNDLWEDWWNEHDDNDWECEVCGGEGVREYMDAPEEWGEDCPSEKNHLIECSACAEIDREREASFARYVFPRLWDSLNAANGYGWDANPWVWAVMFRKLARRA